jgi:hypothetical protein
MVFTIVEYIDYSESHCNFSLKLVQYKKLKVIYGTALLKPPYQAMDLVISLMENWFCKIF